VYGTLYKIAFLPNGNVDFESTLPGDYETVSLLLLPTTEWLQEELGINAYTLDLLNWMFVSYYWVLLADFGQTAPTTHGLTAAEGFEVSYEFSAKNNIFVNDTLFQIYYSYMQSVVVPIIQTFQPNLTLPDIAPPDGTDHLEPSADTYFLRSYSCLERRSKAWPTAAITVLVADYALIMGPYAFLTFLLGWFEKRKGRGNRFYRFS